MQYRPAKIYPESMDLSVRKWYVYYWFMHPFKGQYERKKVYEDINLYKGESKVEYAKNLRDAVNLALRNGYSPFDEVEKVEMWIQETEKRNAAASTGVKTQFTMIQGLKLFLTAKEKEGKSDSTISAYTTTANFMRNWLNDNGMLLVPAALITDTQYMDMITVASVDKETGVGWANKTYNNYLLYLETILNWLAEKINGNIIPENPIKGATQRETLKRKPSAYTDQELQAILKDVRDAGDTYMEGIILTCYYAAVRSKAEMRALKVENILFDRDMLLLSADGTKARREDYVPLDPVLKEFYLKQGYDRLPKDWYLFGKDHRPGPEMAAENYYARVYKPIRERHGIDDAKKLYNWKHTRAIHLATSGVSPYAIMELFRHTTLEQTMIYLRDLGLLVNREAVENSRVI
ncbi:tyrosine-type recombinase/integrase [Chitinophaga niabensis]|uniref:tyrosine-type recombinase/integrase n=1 Tax=Chitinophaga niabensis TaxID=536979 RepID=UPI0031BAA168